MKATAKWEGGFKSTLTDGRNHSVIVDLSKNAGGEDLGATALELTAMGLAGCISTIYKLVADKMRITYSELEVDLEAVKTKTDKTITSVDMKVYIKSDVDKAKLDRCLETTVKTCPVGIIFDDAGIPINHELILK